MHPSHPMAMFLPKLNYLTSVAKEWQTKMVHSHLSHHNATFSLHHIILRKLNYPLLATIFSLDQCQLIMKPILTRGLPSASIIDTYPRALVHSLLKFAGLDLPNLHTGQMITQLQQMLCTPDTTDVTAFLLCTCCESMQLEIGLAAGKLFDTPSCLQVVVTCSWLKHIWLTAQSFDITVHLGIQHILPLWSGNINIMRAFLQHGYWKPENLCSLNWCCTFLHAFWLSDICTSMGDSIDSQIWHAHSPCLSNWNWPQQMPPSAAGL